MQLAIIEIRENTTCAIHRLSQVKNVG